VLLALFLPGLVPQVVARVRRGLACDEGRPVETCYTPVEQAFLRAASAARSLPDTAVIMVQREAGFAWHSGRRGVYPLESAGRRPQELLAYLADRGVTHIVITPVTRAAPVETAQQLNGICHRLTTLGGFGQDTYLFALKSDAADTEEGSACGLTDRLLREAVATRAERMRIRDRFGLPRPPAPPKADPPEPPGT
jgi:hypothetical protein